MKSPREVDATIAAIYAPANDHRRTIYTSEKLLRSPRIQKNPARVTELKNSITAATDALAALDAQAAPFHALYRANPWTRFYLVSGGHLHRSTSCASLRPTTSIGWLTEYSGKSEDEIVALAGEACCTICYRSAPVNRPSMLPVHVAERKAAAAEAAERKAQRATAVANTITVGKTTYKTQRAAENQINADLDTMISRRYMEAADPEHRAGLDAMAARDEEAARAIAEALTEQIEGYDGEAILAKKFASKIKEYRKYGHWAIPDNAEL